MKSPEETDDLLDLENDLLLTREDMAYMNQERIDTDPHLGKYFDFLEEIGAFDQPVPERTFYDEEFELQEITGKWPGPCT